MVCSLVSRIPFAKQIKRSCSLNNFSSQLYTSCSFAFFSQTDWGLNCKVFPHMKVLSHFHWQTFIMLFCIFLVLPCLWFLHAIFQNWVEYLSRCKKEKLLQRLAKLRRGEKTELLIVSSASTFSYFCHYFVPHHTPQSTAVCLEMQFCDKDKLLSLNRPSLRGQKWLSQEKQGSG